MKNTISRRQVLRGAFGFTVALPFMSSLMPREAWGQSVPRLPRFFAMTTDHGGLLESAMFPSTSLLKSTQNLYPGLTIRYGNLARTVDGSTAKLSTVLAGAADRLTDALVAKMNVLYGLDIPFYIAHHSGGHLGNFARNDGNGSDGKSIQNSAMPTIDQLMAWSPSFYSDLSSVKERSISAGPKGGISWGWSNPSARTGNIQEVRTTADAGALFQRVFIKKDAPQEPARPLIVDRVIESYRSLRQSNTRLSAADKQRLDDHMDRLAELQRRVQARPVAGQSCQNLPPPAGGGNTAANMRALTDVMAAAFICGTCRVGVLGALESSFASFSGDWHQDIAHQWSSPEPQRLLQQVNRSAFADLFLELARKLDVEDVPGSTVLDNTLMTWSQESGMETHEARSIPVVTAGSAAGALKTGLFVDYRNLTPAGMVKSYGEPQGPSGLLYSQWLATCLQAMRIPASEWQSIKNNGKTGYGLPLIDENYEPVQVDGIVDGASHMLPVIAA